MILAPCLAGVLLAANSRPDSGRDTTNAVHTIIQLEDSWRVAQWHTDTTAFLKLLAADVTFIGTSGSFRMRADYIASRVGSTIPQAPTFTVSELNVRLFGSTAVVTGREATSGERANSARFTHVWVLRRRRWQLVAVQRTDIVPN
jgi:uncharacterized protein (TIGR02246 family)